MIENCPPLVIELDRCMGTNSIPQLRYAVTTAKTLPPHDITCKRRQHFCIMAGNGETPSIFINVNTADYLILVDDRVSSA